MKLNDWRKRRKRRRRVSPHWEQRRHDDLSDAAMMLEAAEALQRAAFKRLRDLVYEIGATARGEPD